MQQSIHAIQYGWGLMEGDKPWVENVYEHADGAYVAI